MTEKKDHFQKKRLALHFSKKFVFNCQKQDARKQSSAPKFYQFMIMIWINGFKLILEPEINRLFRVNHPIPNPIYPIFFRVNDLII